MNNFLTAFQNLKIDYGIVLAILAFLSLWLVAELTLLFLEKFDIFFYELRSKLFRSGSFSIKNLPKAPEIGSSTDVSFFIIIVGVVLGVITAVIAMDPMISPVLLICFPFLGYSFYRNRSTGINIEKRVQFNRLLRIYANDLKTVQSAQLAAENLARHYRKIPAKQKDLTFERNLNSMMEEVKQNVRIEEAADRLFSGDEVYKTFSDVVSVTSRSGTAAGVDFAHEKIKATGEWKKLVNLMGSSMSAIKFAAIVLEVFLVLGIFVAVIPLTNAAVGGMGNVIHNYFFGAVANKVLFMAIIIGHTVVEFCFMEFIKINNESI